MSNTPLSHYYEQFTQIMSDPLNLAVLRQSTRDAANASDFWVVPTALIAAKPKDYLYLMDAWNTYYRSMSILAACEATDNLLRELLRVLPITLTYGAFNLPKVEWTAVSLNAHNEALMLGIKQRRVVQVMSNTAHVRYTSEEFYTTYCARCPNLARSTCVGVTPHSGLDMTDCPREYPTHSSTAPKEVEMFVPPHMYLMEYDAPESSVHDFTGLSKRVKLLMTQFEQAEPEGVLVWSDVLPSPNVYSRGHICWGEESPRVQDMISTFWATPFNRDLISEKTSMLSSLTTSQQLEQAIKESETTRLFILKPPSVGTAYSTDIAHMPDYRNWRHLQCRTLEGGEPYVERTVFILSPEPWRSVECYSKYSDLIAVRGSTKERKRDLYIPARNKL